MVHSVELVFDSATETAIRRLWDELRDVGIPSQAPASRPHTTLTVAEHIDTDVDALLASLAGRFPMPCLIGAPLLFGRSKTVLAKLLVPTAELLELHAAVDRLCRPYVHPTPMQNALPGRWTPHVTLARRVTGAQLGRALRIVGGPELEGELAGLRRWDGKTKQEYPIRG